MEQICYKRPNRILNEQLLDVQKRLSHKVYFNGTCTHGKSWVDQNDDGQRSFHGKLLIG